jgi:urocanate hydratase
MHLEPNRDETQPRILRAYTILHQLRPLWGGGLIVSLGLDQQGAALSIASNIAGAVSLAIDNNPTHIREVVRTGACDFVVNTLDEAIRVIKNEVRKRAPLSVALSADPFLILGEVLERGLSPQLFSTFLTDVVPDQTDVVTQAADRFRSQGAMLIDFTDQSDPSAVPQLFEASDMVLTPLLAERHWSLHTLSFSTAAALRSFDARVLSSLPPEDILRRRWLDAAPRILRRQRIPQRSLWLTELEATALSPIL